jgi:DNA-binding CsgD family transcriptional regulator
LLRRWRCVKSRWEAGLEGRASIAEIVGRDGELRALEAFFDDTSAEGLGLVLTGAAGIGKTTLWEAGIDVARDRGYRVLVARPCEPETSFAFAGLADLLAEIDVAELDGCPAPQRRALEIAVLREDPHGSIPAPFAVSIGLANLLRLLSRRQRVLVAVDDVPWLDRPSAEALRFAARRVSHHGVRFLLTHRIDQRHELERALESTGIRRLEVFGLSFGATRLLLFERLGLTVSRRVLRRLFEIAHGNPLFALELGRVLVEQGVPEGPAELDLPDRLDELFGARVESLTAPVRRTLLVAGLSGALRTWELASLADATVVEDAVESGVLVVDGDRVRPSHPLLAESAKKRSSARERRDLHADLARVVGDATLRARHLARATETPDAHLATTIAEASENASARGAVDDAVELAEQAFRLTPPTSAEWNERVLAFGESLMLAGEHQRARELLLSRFDLLPAGPVRARAHLLLADSGFQLVHADDSGAHLQQALAESVDEPGLRALSAARWSRHLSAARVERIEEAERLALEVLPAARQAGTTVEREVLHSLALTRILRGRAIHDLCDRFEAISSDAFHLFRGVERLEADRLGMRGHVREGRAALRQLLALADERGEAWSSMWLLHQLCELELRAGEWEIAAALLDEWEDSPDRPILAPQAYSRCRALLAAGRGDAEEAEAWAAGAIAESERRGLRWDLLESLRARGIAALMAHDPARAAEPLETVWEHTEREGVEEPGAFPVAPDLVEAFVEVGRTADAEYVSDRLRSLAEAQLHPWGLASAKRCRALVALASRIDVEHAATELREAAHAYAELGLRFDHARAMLSLGRASRRLRRWGAARTALQESAGAFAKLGSEGWAAEAQVELSRIGGRRACSSDQLTPTEQRAARLAAEGLSNKEIAAQLFVTVHTIEVHLSHAYAKLGVRSRAQLGQRLSAVAPAQES